jgi:hypothetical protein
MDQDHFWDIVSQACRSDSRRQLDWARQLTTALTKLAPDEIIEWNHIFDRLAARAYTVDLWAAAYLINGGASDDGFYYFRCWLICMGRDTYEAAVANPDTLADVVTPGIDAEVETYAAAHLAWLAVTGNPYSAPYPARNEHAELVGEPWDYDDAVEMRNRLPRLSAIYAD